MLAVLRRRDHAIHVVDVAEGHHAIQILARHGQDEGPGTGGDEQTNVLGLGTVLGDHLAFDPVDLYDPPALVQGDAVVGIPLLVVEHDLVDGLLTGQHRREHDPVVVAVGLVSKDRDVVSIGGHLEQFLHGADPRHAVPDDNQFFFHASLQNESRALRDT